MQRTTAESRNEFGFITNTLTERYDDTVLVTTTEVVDDFGDGVQLVRHSVRENGRVPTGLGTATDVRLRVNLDHPGTPSPIEHERTAALLLPRAADLIAAAERFGYVGKDDPLAFLQQTRGHGCLPVQSPRTH